MKHFVSLLLTVALSINLTIAQEGTTIIGVVDNGKPKLNIDYSKTLRIYNANLLRFSGINAQFNKIELIPLHEGDYGLLFSGNNWKSVIYVKVINNQLHALAKTSCSTSDCSEERLGCIVKYAFPGDEIGYCTPCSNGGKCTKTSSSSSLLQE